MGHSIDSALTDGEPLVDVIARARALGGFPDDLPPIEVFEFRGQVFSLDNRRLYIAQEAGVRVPVVVRFPEVASEQDRLTSLVAGLFVEVR